MAENRFARQIQEVTDPQFVTYEIALLPTVTFTVE